MQYKHFSVEEREAIQEGLWNKESLRGIARRVGRSHTSVSREIARNNPVVRKRYTPRTANARALEYRKKRGRTEHLKNEMIRSYVIEHLQLRWSPEQIAGRMEKENIGSISTEAIYQFIYAQVKNGYPKKDCTDLRPYLRRRRKRRIPHGARKGQRVASPMGVSIDQRPRIVKLRSRIGDWEGDTVESKDHRPGINTLVERKTGLTMITKLESKSGAATASAVTQRFSAFPLHLTRTLTLDNGPENRDWRTLEKKTGARIFFAHPYHSWERGTNENTNGLIRDYFPKKTDFTSIPDAAIACVEYALNTRPRKRLGWKTPLETWSGALQG